MVDNQAHLDLGKLTVATMVMDHQMFFNQCVIKMHSYQALQDSHVCCLICEVYHENHSHASWSLKLFPVLARQQLQQCS